ncbi:MAG TPA: DUF4326 domain-containing protein [Myxococcaceae bacterium]|nr:DUF4326 domain-containing protein [Myxococcaceae bacterium]
MKQPDLATALEEEVAAGVAEVLDGLAARLRLDYCRGCGAGPFHPLVVYRDCCDVGRLHLEGLNAARLRRLRYEEAKGTRWPRRHQRSRRRGARLLAEVVSCTRPGPFSNPFLTSEYGPAGAVERFRAWLAEPAQAALVERLRRELRGRDLACWCPLVGADGRWFDPPPPCHVDVLLEVANP